MIDTDRRLAKRRWVRERLSANWPHQFWFTSKRGNPCTKADGVYITVFPYKDGFRLAVGDVFGKKTYPDVESARAAARDAFLWMHEKGD